MPFEFTYDVVLFAILGVVAVAALWLLVSYNRLVRLSYRCDEARADVDVYLRQRHDLLPNFVETVRAFVGHERSIIESVTKARLEAMRAMSMQGQQSSETILGSLVNKVMAMSDSYPELQASEHYRRLRDELCECENKIAAARRFLNMSVREYNAAREQFPATLLTDYTGHAQKAGFDLGETRTALEAAPAVKL